MRITGTALLYTLVISMIIGVLVYSLILLRFYREKEAEMSFEVIEVNSLIRSGIEILRSNSSFKDTSITLSSTGNIVIQGKPWGFYDRYTIKGIKGSTHDSLIVLVGLKHSEEFGSFALSIPDNGRQLRIGGTSKVVGDALVPDGHMEEIRSGSLRLQNRPSINGNLRNSGKYLETTNPISTTYVQNRMELFVENLRSDPRSNNILEFDNISFGEETLFSNSTVVLAGEIRINQGCRTENCVVIADKIIIGSGFKGKGQFIARDTIVIEDNAELSFPSLILIPPQDLNSGAILIGEGSSIRGALYNISCNPNSTGIRFNKSEVLGSVQCSGIVSGEFTIKGELICTGVDLELETGYYGNTIFNAHIEYDSVFLNFLPILGPSQSSSRRVCMEFE